jgi:hypothetical protein
MPYMSNDDTSTYIDCSNVALGLIMVLWGFLCNASVIVCREPILIFHKPLNICLLYEIVFILLRSQLLNSSIV